MDIFDYARSVNSEKESPLASRLRPKTLDQVVGQEHIIGKDKLLYRLRKRPDHWINKGRTAFCPIINNTIQGGFVQQVQLLFYCENGVLKRK